ncbi:hypothetical protein FPHYL_7629 [Fusarium phyllophilum]|uniref:Uncharacterized protein n=1 Tax=Fusarium phyllophilum TaxID=47803 RepID=A0A8H5N9G7_9HYPO|nr:hypothetical protein FPHYL_7629 [Fusarium phyllophilum]
MWDKKSGSSHQRARRGFTAPDDGQQRLARITILLLYSLNFGIKQQATQSGPRAANSKVIDNEDEAPSASYLGQQRSSMQTVRWQTQQGFAATRDSAPLRLRRSWSRQHAAGWTV